MKEVSILSVILSIGIYLISLETFYHIEIAILRMPIYFIGMYCAELACDNKDVNLRAFVGAISAILLKAITGYLDFPFSRLFNAPYAIVLILFYICLRKRMKDENLLKQILKSVGQYSLELYIVHVSLRAIMEMLGMKLAMPWVYGLCIIISVPISVGYASLHNRFF